MDKYSGGLALGAHGHGVGGADLDAALETAVIGDVLEACDSDGSSLHLHVGQDPNYGGVRLTVEPESNELHTDAIARSQMHSMLSDRARCEKYAAALADTVQPHSHVLDIGTGTGLLAILSARCGAQHVTAAEMYSPLAKLAELTVNENGVENTVIVHAAPSTALTVGNAAHLPRRADVLVTEIFDSALLGEACLTSMAHAHQNLLTSDAKIIPARARLYARVVHSDPFRSFHHLGPEFPFHRSSNGPACTGGNIGTPVHVDALSNEYVSITEAFEVFRFEFSKDGVSLSDRCTDFNVKRVTPGRADALITWWELDLNEDGSVCYSTSPGAEPWQDHWLPVVYPLPALSPNVDSPTIKLSAGHDAARVWFSANSNARCARSCSCGFHALPGGATRVSALADGEYLKNLSTRIRDALSESQGPVLDVSDGSVCALIAAEEMKKTGTSSEIVSLESHAFSQHLYAQVARRANASISFMPSLEGVVNAETKFAVILAEPFYHACLNRPVLTFANLLVQARALSRSDNLSKGARFVPARGELVARVVRFRENEDPFVRAPAVVTGVKHISFAKLSAAASQAAVHMHLPLYMHGHDSGKEVVIGVANFGASLLEVKTMPSLAVPPGKGRAAVALHVCYDSQPGPKMAHDLLLPLTGIPDNTDVTVQAEWDGGEGQWSFEVSTMASTSDAVDVLAP